MHLGCDAAKGAQETLPSVGLVYAPGRSRRFQLPFTRLEDGHRELRAAASRGAPLVAEPHFYCPFKPYTSSSPCGLAALTGSCPVAKYTFPFATIGDVNLIPYPGASPEFSPLL